MISTSSSSNIWKEIFAGPRMTSSTSLTDYRKKMNSMLLSDRECPKSMILDCYDLSRTTAFLCGKLLADSIFWELAILDSRRTRTNLFYNVHIWLRRRWPWGTQRKDNFFLSDQALYWPSGSPQFLQVRMNFGFLRDVDVPWEWHFLRR